MPTLLALRVGIDVLIGLVFLGQMRRYPAIGGPGWWALSALMNIVGAAALSLRGTAPDVFTIGVAKALLSIGPLMAWMGLRSYLNLRGRPLRVALGALALLVIQVMLTAPWDLPRLRMAVFVLATAAIALLAWRDMGEADPQRSVPELQALRLLTAVEILGLLAFGAAVPLGGWPMATVAPVALFILVLDRLLRVILYGALVSYRLREEGDRARRGLQLREANSRALVDNLSAGVMVFRPDQTLIAINNAARRFLGWGEGGANPALPEPTMANWSLLREDGQAMRRHDMPVERVLVTGQPMRNVIVGLPVVLGIVQVHGGDIEVRSQPGQGTTFVLYFPGVPGAPPPPGEPRAGDAVTMGTIAPERVKPAATKSLPMADPATPDPAPHILYLDDDDTLVFLVRRLLERRGYRVTALSDQRQAIEAVQADPQGFHLLLTDYNMPGMSGLDVARAALAINPALPVAVASGYITDELQAQALAAGVREVVFKTDAVEAFCEMVARLVQR